MIKRKKTDGKISLKSSNSKIVKISGTSIIPFSPGKATVTITVKKAIPYIKVQPSVANAYTHGDYLYNQKLTGEAICGDGMGGEGVSSETQSSVAGTFTWKTPSTKLSYKENSLCNY